MITIKNIIDKFQQIQQADARLHAFVPCGTQADLLQDIKYYPYFAVILEPSHDILFTEVNGYRTIEYNFILRVADKNNQQKNVYVANGLNSSNGLDIISETFVILTDIINCISEDSLLLFTDMTLVNDIEAEPFYNEDTGDCNGFEARITLRVKNDNPCVSPITYVP